MNIIKIAALSAATIMISAGSASAYTLNGDGTGYVGKGEVQTLLGFNNKVMQAEHTKVTFKYVASADVSFTCTWTTGEGTRGEKTHIQPKTETTSVQAVVVGDSRKTGQWTGWNISGVPTGGLASDPEITDGDCGAEGNEMKTVVEGSIVVGDVTGGLYAVYGTSSYLLTETVPIA